MDLLRIVEAGRRHWVLLLLGLVVGIILAIVSTYRLVTTPDGVHVAARSAAIYETSTRLLIREPRLDVARMSPDQGWPNGYTKTVYMAPTYAMLLLGDEVRQDAESIAGPLQVKLSARPVKDTPVVVLKASGKDPQQTTKAARAITDAFIAYLQKQQDDSLVPQEERVKVVVLSAPPTPSQKSSSAMEIGALALLVPLMASLGIAVSIEGARQRRYNGFNARGAA